MGAYNEFTPAGVCGSPSAAVNLMGLVVGVGCAPCAVVGCGGCGPLLFYRHIAGKTWAFQTIAGKGMGKVSIQILLLSVFGNPWPGEYMQSGSSSGDASLSEYLCIIAVFYSVIAGKNEYCRGFR